MRDWKLQNISPLFKKGSKDDPGNYRPISLTSVPGKMLESIIADDMMSHLEHNKLILDSQHGLWTFSMICLVFMTKVGQLIYYI